MRLGEYYLFYIPACYFIYQLVILYTSLLFYIPARPIAIFQLNAQLQQLIAYEITCFIVFLFPQLMQYLKVLPSLETKVTLSCFLEWCFPITLDSMQVCFDLFLSLFSKRYTEESKAMEIRK